MNLNTSLEDNESDEETNKAFAKVEKVKQEKQEKIKIQNEENSKFINTVLKYVKVHHNSSYLQDLKSLDYSKISEDLGGMPIEECRNKLKNLIMSLPKVKSLHEVLRDSYIKFTKVSFGKTKGFNVFLLANAKHIQEELNRTKSKRSALDSFAASMWKRLTDKEKLAYEGIKAEGETPFNLYYESEREKNNSLTLMDAKRTWISLPMSVREKFIKESAEMKMSAVNSQKDMEIEKFDSIMGPSKKEISDYFIVHGMPERPSKSLKLSYLTKCGEYDNTLRSSELVRLACQKFNQLTIDEQRFWTRKFEKSHEKYEKRFKIWEDKLDEVEKFMLRILRQSNKKKVSESSKIKRKEDFHSVAMPYTKTYFEITPFDVPKLGAASVYRQEMEKKHGKKFAYNNSVKSLTKIERHALNIKIEKLKVDFVNKLKSYVKSLSNEERSIYLGQYRFRFMTLLKEDIFENDFPDSKYPLFIYLPRGKEKTIENEIEIVTPKNQTGAKVKNKNKSTNPFLKKFESSISEIFDDISLEDLDQTVNENKIKRKLNKSKISDKKENNKIDKNNNSPEKTEDLNNIKVKDEEENSLKITTEKSKRKRSNYSSESKKKRRKLNDDEGNSMVKFDQDTDNDEEGDLDLQNISEYLNSIEFENADIKFNDIVKEEHDIDFFDY